MLDRGWEVRDDYLVRRYTRVAADPPGPVSLSVYNDLPYRGLPVESVTSVNEAGPNGAQLQRLQVNYCDEDAVVVTFHDRYRCHMYCPWRTCDERCP